MRACYKINSIVKAKEVDSLCSYAFQDEDGNFKYEENAPCYAGLTTRGEMKSMGISLLHCKTYKAWKADKKSRSPIKHYNRYFNYLFNHSPFKDSFVTKSVSSAMRNGVELSLDVPHSQAVAAAVACRVSWEHPQKFLTFNDLFDEGFDGFVCMLLSNYLAKDTKGRYCHHGPSGHSLIGYPKVSDLKQMVKKGFFHTENTRRGYRIFQLFDGQGGFLPRTGGGTVDSMIAENLTIEKAGWAKVSFINKTTLFALATKLQKELYK